MNKKQDKINLRGSSQPIELWEIFYAESEKHLDNINFFKERTIYSLSEVELRKLNNCLHRLKGGLGFLGLKELSNDVTICEALVKTMPKEKIKELNQLSVNIKILREEIGLLF